MKNIKNQKTKKKLNRRGRTPPFRRLACYIFTFYFRDQIVLGSARREQPLDKEGTRAGRRANPIGSPTRQSSTTPIDDSRIAPVGSVKGNWQHACKTVLADLSQKNSMCSDVGHGADTLDGQAGARLCADGSGPQYTGVIQKTVSEFTF